MAQNLLRPAAPGQLPMHLFQAGGVLSGGGLPGLAQMASVPQLGPGRTPASSGRDAAGRPIMPLPASSHGSPGPFTMISKQSKVGSNLPPLQGAVFPTSSFALGGAGGAAWAMLGLGHPVTQLSTLQWPGAGPASSMGLWGQAQGQAAGIQLQKPFTVGAPPFGMSARGAALHAPAPIDLRASAAGGATAAAQDQDARVFGKPPLLGSGGVVAKGESIQPMPILGECVQRVRGDLTAAAITTAVPQGGDATTFMASETPSVAAKPGDFTSSLKYSPAVSGGETGPVSVATWRGALGDVSAASVGSPTVGTGVLALSPWAKGGAVGVSIGLGWGIGSYIYDRWTRDHIADASIWVYYDPRCVPPLDPRYIKNYLQQNLGIVTHVIAAKLDQYGKPELPKDIGVDRGSNSATLWLTCNKVGQQGSVTHLGQTGGSRSTVDIGGLDFVSDAGKQEKDKIANNSAIHELIHGILRFVGDEHTEEGTVMAPTNTDPVFRELNPPISWDTVQAVRDALNLRSTE